ncbi:MAG TPA: SDR family NAD(P)-dependent oxidoreductase [bacterium]
MTATPRALVTGASEGIGRVFALRLARDGYAVTAVARNEARLQSLMAELGPGHDYRVADLADPAHIAALGEHLARVRCNLLVNNAAFGIYGDFARVPLPELQRLLRLNVDALVALSHAFLRQAQAGDALVNVSSILAFLPMPLNGIYAATKAFVTSFSESLWQQQRPRGVYVLGLCPGGTATLFHERAGAGTRSAGGAVQTPEQVVEAAMRALRSRRSPTVVSGWHNRLFVFATRLLPRKWVVSAMGRQSPPTRHD